MAGHRASHKTTTAVYLHSEGEDPCAVLAATAKTTLKKKVCTVNYLMIHQKPCGAKPPPGSTHFLYKLGGHQKNTMWGTPARNPLCKSQAGKHNCLELNKA